MQTIHVNGYDMAYLVVGEGPPLVCVHGSLCDFRVWSAVLGPLTQRHRVIAVSLRHFFPEHWDGVGDTYSIAQHTADVIGFIEKLDTGPVDLMGHSRGGQPRPRAGAFDRVEEQRQPALDIAGSDFLGRRRDPRCERRRSGLSCRIERGIEFAAGFGKDQSAQ